MIKKMRLKFFAVTGAIVVLMIAIFCGAIIVSTKIRNNNGAQNSLDRIVNIFENFPDESIGNDNKGIIKLQINDFRSFAVIIDNDSNFIKEPNISYYTEQEIRAYITQIQSGNVPKFFLVAEKDLEDGQLIAWIDRSIEIEDFNNLTLTVCIIGVSGILVLLILVWFLSFWIVKPARFSLENQKRFISEASHELKTPLTIISAGIELLQKQNKNEQSKKWLKSIKQQTDKMSVMTTDLLALSKLEETQTEKRIDFNLSQAILNEVLSFESVAFEERKEIDCNIQENVTYRGKQNAVSQAVAILCDNAIKHSDKKALIKIVFKKQNSKNLLTVINTGGNIKENEIPLLFERFYRGSTSRAETQGTGLGLSILKTLAEQNGWKINVQVHADKVIFNLNF